MKMKAMILWLGLVLLPCVHAQTTTNSDQAIQQEILVYINAYRQQHGLKPLTMNEHITTEAKQHSIDMANHSLPFGHHYFKDRINRLRAEIRHATSGAENIAYHYKNAQDVVENWIQSPGHRRNIVGPYNLTGIGVARDNRGGLYFTQIFLKTEITRKKVLPFGFIFK